MPAYYYVDQESKIILGRWEGEAIDSEFVKALLKFQKEAESIPNYRELNEFADFSEVTRFRLTRVGMKRLSELSAEFDAEEGGQKVAILVGSNFAFGLARMYEAYRNCCAKTTKQVRTFKDRDQALEWLSS